MPIPKNFAGNALPYSFLTAGSAARAACGVPQTVLSAVLPVANRPAVARRTASNPPECCDLPGEFVAAVPVLQSSQILKPGTVHARSSRSDHPTVACILMPCHYPHLSSLRIRLSSMGYRIPGTMPRSSPEPKIRAASWTAPAPWRFGREGRLGKHPRSICQTRQPNRLHHKNRWTILAEDVGNDKISMPGQSREAPIVAERQLILYQLGAPPMRNRPAIANRSRPARPSPIQA